jgi:hypothetical protein
MHRALAGEPEAELAGFDFVVDDERVVTAKRDAPAR